MSKLNEMFGQQVITDSESGIEKAIGEIADKLSYSKNLERLMQITRVSNIEKEAFSILYALNHGKLRSKVLKDYLMSRFSLANSEKGQSRAEMIEVVKAGTPQVPKGFWGRMKDKVDF